ncbi:DUF6427 family protein [Polaribacter sargassicola]|uniref:DUF6427 family protein n=1 Tax=Polaribacter sargassicola TaxID=2836891 RepID=UPI001F3E6E37|nr:DUF6427 family protein [Polaribacter sp. DS7-9]MCG1035232.1 hypothetical protein [Polaribacter sp. DS7-9]
MLANFLEKSKPINFTVYLLSFYCVFFTYFFSNNFTWATALENALCFFLFLFIFFFYNFIVTKNKLTFDHSYAFFLFTLTSISFLPKILEVKTLVLLLIYLLFLRKIYSLRTDKKVIQKLFDSGFWLGILFIIQPYSILFVTLIYSSNLLQKKVTINTFLTPIIGFVSPLIIYFAYLLWSDSSQSFVQLFYFDNINNISFYTEDKIIWLLSGIISLTIIAVFLKSPKALSVNNSFRKSWILLIINTIIAVFFALIIDEKKGSDIIFLLIPSSIIIANGFEVIEKNMIKNILSGTLIIATIIVFILQFSTVS